MTEQEWNSCADPGPMLEFLKGKASDRKLRLFAVACCRKIWHLLADERSRTAVDVAGRAADRQATKKEFSDARRAAVRAYHDAGQISHSLWLATDRTYRVGDKVYRADDAFQPTDATKAAHAATNAAYAAQAATNTVTQVAATETARYVAIAASQSAFEDCPTLPAAREAALAPAHAEQSVIVLEIFGNPFRPVTLDPTWLTSTVKNLAEAIYEERAFDRLPILADALEDAGCNQQDILSHLRGGGEHCRGCWPLDLVLGKE
jgi:hypothetical protein